MYRVARVKIGHFHTLQDYCFWDIHAAIYDERGYIGHTKFNQEAPCTVDLLREHIRRELDCDQVYIQENLLFPMPHQAELDEA